MSQYISGSKWVGIGSDPNGRWNREGARIQISDIVTDKTVFTFDASEYSDMSAFGEWNHEMDVSDVDNITGMFFYVLRTMMPIGNQ